MKSEEIFETSVKVMKDLLTPEGIKTAIQRAKARTEADNAALMEREREHVNELVRDITARGDGRQQIKDVSPDLVDALVLRYLRNREIFMKTFPDGIDDADPDPLSLWAAIMISPLDERPAG